VTLFLNWASNLPAHWEAKPLRAVADYMVSNVDKVPADNEAPVRLCNYTDVYNNEFITLDLDFMRATATAMEIEKFGLKVDDVVITKDSESWDDIGVPAIVKETASNLVCGYHLAVLRPRKQTLDGSFLFRCLQAKPVRVQLELAANGVTRFGIPKADIGAMTLPIPPLSQQRTIADFLGRETARLDGLVAAKERVLGLLTEKRWVLITRAVTRGLDPRAPLRDSGIHWLGEIPAHWRVAGFTKYLRSLVDYRGKTPEKTPFGVFLVTARNIRDGRIDYEASQEFVHMEAYEEAMRRGKPTIGDLLLTTEAPLGQAALVDRTDIALAQRVIKLDYDPTVVLNEFALLWIRSALFQWQLNSLATGSTALGIKGERLHMLCNLLPPVDEQRAIVAHIATETAKLDALRSATERTIALLKERRAALIAAAVTGRLHIPEAT